MQIITLPQAKKDMQDGTVSRWLKGVGESVCKGDVLLEVQACRYTVAIQAGLDGTLAEILAPVGTTPAVGDPLGRIAAAGETQTPSKKSSKKSEKAKETTMAGPKGTVTPILMPKAGNSMEEGTILAWQVKVGDAIKEGDVIFDVETDKAAVEVEALDSGRLARIVADEGDTIEVLLPIAYLADSDEDVDAYIAQNAPQESQESKKSKPVAAPETKAAAATSTSAPQAPAVTTDTGRVKASPAARKIASSRGVDLAAVGAGSGPGGRIISTDVPVAGGAGPLAPAIRSNIDGQEIRTPLSSMRQGIGKALQASKQTVPHFYIELTVDAQPMMDFYRLEKAKYKCSLNDVVLLACAKTIAEFPAFRSQLDGGDLVTGPSANIGVAVGVEGGLTVPVVIGADRMNLAQAAAESRRVVEAARGGKLIGYGEGVFTISNLGMFGIERFSAIINPPEAAILAVGTVREEVIVSGGTMRPGRRMTVTLSCDHRVIDGLEAAKFLGRLKQYLEAPTLLA